VVSHKDIDSLGKYSSVVLLDGHGTIPSQHLSPIVKQYGISAANAVIILTTFNRGNTSI
jgi:hypothetical protein